MGTQEEHNGNRWHCPDRGVASESKNTNTNTLMQLGQNQASRAKGAMRRELSHYYQVPIVEMRVPSAPRATDPPLVRVS